MVMDWETAAGHVRNGELEPLLVGVRQGFDVNQIGGERGLTLLHVAAERGVSDIAQFLLLSGANPDVTFSDGRTAVHAAAERGDLALLRALINAGSILDARDSSGLTPLHICCMNAHAEAIFLLAVEGADMTARTNENQTPKDLIASSLGSHAQRTASLARLEDAANLLPHLHTAPPTSPSFPSASASADLFTARPAARSIEQRPVERPPKASGAPKALVNFFSPDSATDVPVTASSPRRASAPSAAALPSPSAAAAVLRECDFGQRFLWELTRRQRALFRRLAERRLVQIFGEARTVSLLLASTSTAEAAGAGAVSSASVPALASSASTSALGSASASAPTSNPKFFKYDPLPSAPSPASSFGAALSRLPLVPYALDNGAVVRIPYVAQQCLAYLHAHAYRAEGVFRKPGNTRRMNQLKSTLDERHVSSLSSPTWSPPPLDLDGYSVNDVAGLFKRFMRELAEPIFTARLQGMFHAAASIENERERMIALQLLLVTLPSANRDLAHALLLFLRRIAVNADGEDGNKMNANNLAVVWAPNLARSLTAEKMPAGSMGKIEDLKIEHEEGVISTRLVEILIDNAAELCVFQSARVLDFPLSRTSSILLSRRTKSYIPPPTVTIPVSSPTLSSPITSVSLPPNHGEDSDTDSPSTALADSDADSDSDDDVINTRLLHERFSRDPLAMLPVVMSSLETRAERRIRRHRGTLARKGAVKMVNMVKGESEREVERVKERVKEAARVASEAVEEGENGENDEENGKNGGKSGQNGAESENIGAKNVEIGTKNVEIGTKNVEISSKNDKKDTKNNNNLPSLQTARRAARRDDKEQREFFYAVGPRKVGVAIFGNNGAMNKEIAKQFAEEAKRGKARTLFGDVWVKDAVRIHRREVGYYVANPVNIEEIDIDDLFSRMSSNVDIRDRRRKLVHVFKQTAVGREIVDWLVTSAVPANQIHRRQAVEIAREMFEMGALLPAHPSNVGFKDEGDLYRFNKFSLEESVLASVVREPPVFKS